MLQKELEAFGKRGGLKVCQGLRALAGRLGTGWAGGCMENCV